MSAILPQSQSLKFLLWKIIQLPHTEQQSYGICQLFQITNAWISRLLSEESLQ